MPRTPYLVAILALAACGGPAEDPDDTDDTDVMDDTDVADDTDAMDDTDVMDDTDAADDTDAVDDTDPPTPAAAALGTWTVSTHDTTCGNGFSNGAVATAVEGEPLQFSLRLQGVVEQETVGTLCTLDAGDPTTFTCTSTGILGGSVCNVQADYTQVAGTVSGGAFTIQGFQRITLGPDCPPQFVACGPTLVSAAGSVVP